MTGPEPDANSQAEPSGEKPPRDWRSMHLWQFQPVRDVLVVLSILWLLQLGYMLRLVTVPLLLAVALAYLFEPLVVRLTRVRWINRQVAAGGIIVAGAVLVVVPVTLGAGFAVVQGVGYARTLATNVEAVIESAENPENEQLRADLPNDAWVFIRDWLVEQQQREAEAREEMAEEIRQRGTRPAEGGEGRDPSAGTEGDGGNAGGEPGANPGADPGSGSPTGRGPAVGTTDEAVTEALASSATQRSDVIAAADYVLNWVRANADAIAKQALETGSGAVSAALGAIASIGLLFFSGFLTAFFFFFICTGWGRVRGFWSELIPERRKSRVFDLASKMDVVISGFIRGRLIIAFILSIYFTVAYWVIGLPMPLVFGPAVGLISIVPYVALISIPITITALWLDPHTMFAFQESIWWVLLAPVAVYQIGQLADDYVLTPLIQGKTTDMETPTILFASIAGGVLAGVYGLLIAIPAAACIKILLREIFWPRVRAWSRGEASDILPFGDD